jgi:hypothetical protein
MSYFYRKKEKEKAEITRAEWYNLQELFTDLTETLADYDDKEIRERAGKLAKAIYELGNKGNWR